MGDLPSLPDDPALLKEVIIQLREELQSSYRRQEQLQHQIDQLARRLFGPRAERIDPNQLVLGLGEVERFVPAVAEDEEEPEDEPPPPRRRRGHGRKRLPEDLPRKVVTIEPPEEERQCRGCGGALSRIGEETKEQLEYVPASFFVLETVRGNWACRHCEEGVVTAPPPPQPIEKGLPGPGLLAHVVVSKYADHLPLARQTGIFARHGVELSRSTLCDWVGAAAELGAPVVAEMKRDLIASKVIHTDDTPVAVLDRSRESTRTARLWVYLGDEGHPHTVFDFTPDRSRDGPATFLEGYEGYLQADAYSAYDGIYAGGLVKEVACMAHARRKFYDARATDPARAFTALAFVRQLYQIEAKARELELPAEKRRSLRQEHAVPVLDGFALWMHEESPQVLPKSPLGEAFTYARLQWQALRRYTEDGDLAIDNNRAERALRTVAVGRKNWLFAGSDEGGRRAAILYSLISSARRHGLDPFAYLRDLFDRLPTHPQTRLAELTPVAWAQALREPAEAAA
jgi:transposase